MAELWEPSFTERWRHGGWYVDNIRTSNGAVGCVTNHDYRGKGWAIACPDIPEASDVLFSTRADAAKAERIMWAALAAQKANA